VKVQYTGPHDEVTVPDFINPETGHPFVIVRGESVEVADELGANLLQQRANWRPAAGGKIRDYADIAADVRALEAKEAEEAEATPAAESPAAAPVETGGTTAED
jgi:hypothetical protein